MSRENTGIGRTRAREVEAERRIDIDGERLAESLRGGVASIMRD